MATKYMSMTGSDTTGDGSLGNPYKTLTKCLAMTTTGDTIYLLPGTYTNTEWPLRTSLTARTISAYVSGSVVVDFQTNVWATSKYGAGGLTFGSGASVINGIEFRNGTDDTSGDGEKRNGFILLQNLAVVQFNQCTFRGQGMHNVVAGGGAGGFCCTPYFVSVVATCTFNGCAIVDYYQQIGTTNSLFLSYGSSVATYSVINCVIVPRSPLVGGSTAITSFGSAGTVAATRFINTIIYNRNASRTFGSSVGIYNNNCAYGFTSIPTGLNNITSDPLFVDPANDDFRLRPNSPCINTGTLL